MNTSIQRVAITGAAGNLGSLLARAMIDDPVRLHLLTHRQALPQDLAQAANVQQFQVDLAHPETLTQALKGVETVVHFAGILFKGRPEKFLPTTNTLYFRNLLQACTQAGVRRVVLVSFPHVEGPTTPENPARGTLEANPISVHAQTRLEEERMLIEHPTIEGVIARCGMVYGRGVLMIDGARWFSQHYLLGIWREPTAIHLISVADFTAAMRATVYNPEARGIYHLGDDGVQTLQTFLDAATQYWHTCRPWRMPLWMIYGAARFFELWSLLTGCRAPLTRDFITIGRVSYYGDTSRMKADLLPELRYPSFREGIKTL